LKDASSRTRSSWRTIRIRYRTSVRHLSLVTIPVIFHVLYSSTNTAPNISQARILAQLAVLNADYARLNSDTGNTPNAFKPVAASSNVRFCLASRDPQGNFTTGIIRKQVTANGFDPITNDHIKYSAQGGDDAWPTTDYLNVWIANFNGASSTLLGISQMPGNAAATDGCCVLYSTVGRTCSPRNNDGAKSRPYLNA
jgi:hypothetical protein